MTKKPNKNVGRMMQHLSRRKSDGKEQVLKVITKTQLLPLIGKVFGKGKNTKEDLTSLNSEKRVRTIYI